MAFVAQRGISIILPAYNEEDNIAKAVEQAVHCLKALCQDWEVIVVNDGSQDKTGEIIDGLAEQNDRVIGLHHPSNQGYGAALKTGILRAHKELIFFCDSDLQFHLSELVLPLTWIEQYDIVVGYRAKRQDPLHRRLNALGWNTVVRLLLGLKVHDIDCAFKLFRSAVFSAIKIDAVGAMVNTDILVQATRMGFKIKEVPVTHFPRLQGKQTGADLRVVLRAFKELFWLYRKLRNIHPIVFTYDRRQGQNGGEFQERRRAERRQVMLPINFPDRRRRFIRVDGLEIPLTFSLDLANLLPVRPRRPLNIAMVAACPFPANHGTPAGIKEAAAAIAKKGHRVHIVTYHFGAGKGPLGASIHRIPNLGFGQKMVVGPTWQKPLFDFLMVLTLCRVVRRESIDLIHAHNYEGALIGYIARTLTRRPLIYNAVNTMSDELPTYHFLRPKSLASWLARFLDHWVPRLADRIIAISDELARFLQARGIGAEHLHVVPLGIDGSVFQDIAESQRAALRERHGLGTRPLVMYTGILDRFQRIDYLLQAMQIVVEKLPEARLMLVVNMTTDQDLQDCRRMIGALGLQAHVEIVTNRSFAEVPLFLAAADVTVVCRPQCPGLPVKLLNYMAAAKPIVVFEGSAKGLRHQHNALVVADHDWQALGYSILTLLQDPALAQTLGQNARQWADEHRSWPNIVTHIENVYYELVEPHDHTMLRQTPAAASQASEHEHAQPMATLQGKKVHGL
jgi:1,2-diacylglycerol 3-alpha-glucosyltransferase